MGTEKNRAYIQEVAKNYMGRLKIRAAAHTNVAAGHLGIYLWETQATNLLRCFMEDETKPETLGLIVSYGVGTSPQGDYQSWHIGHKVRPSGMSTRLDQVLPHDVAKFHNGLYQLMQLAAAAIIAEMVTLMSTRLMIAQVTKSQPGDVPGVDYSSSN